MFRVGRGRNEELVCNLCVYTAMVTAVWEPEQERKKTQYRAWVGLTRSGTPNANAVKTSISQTQAKKCNVQICITLPAVSG